jgi:nucleoside-diphosphate-sugar epimerase
VHVVILGCGYVGLELGRRLRDAGHAVTGVRRSDDGLAAVEAAGLDAVRADVTDADSLAAVPAADHLVFAASAGGRGVDPARETYLRGLETVQDHFAARADPPDRLVYTGSTGVYGDHGGDWVDEATDPAPDSERGEVLLAAERAALDGPLDGTVARFAGLYGPDRSRPDRYLDGPVPPGWLNLLHRDDAAGAVAHLLAADVARDEVVLVVDDEPVRRPDLAAWLADQLGREPPATGGQARRGADKRCSNDRLRDLGYEFVYPTFREGYGELLAEWSGRG